MTKKILIVDDSETDFYLASQAVQKIGGFEILQATSGEQGVEIAKSQKPDVILMDVVMSPGISGFQATRAITHSDDTANIPVIMLTSKDQRSDRVWAEKQGAAGYINKPVDTEELATVLKDVLG